MDVIKRNDALDRNPPTVNGRTADIHITTRGSDWYYTVCALMAISTLTIIALSLRLPRKSRLFYYLTAAICLIPMIAYWTMGSNLGFVPIRVEFLRGAGTVRGIFRQIFYVRFIDHFLTSSLILFTLLLTAGVPWPSILWVVLVDWVMIVSALVGTLVHSIYKWGYFCLACVALLYIVYVLAIEGTKHAKRLGNDLYKTYLMCMGVTLLTWLIYPIAWGVSEYGNIIAPDSAAVFYGILDIISRIIFSALLLFGLRNVDPARLGLSIRDYDEDPTMTGGLLDEKRRPEMDGAHRGQPVNPATVV